MNKYTPEQLKYELGACWEVDEIADLMAACGLEAADALDVLDAPTDKHEDVIWMACRMVRPEARKRFAERCAEDAIRTVRPTCDDPAWCKWANAWLDGGDRSRESARAARVATTNAAYAAAYAAYAAHAADAADAAYAAANAAYAAYAARAADAADAAHAADAADAAYAARAASYAVNASCARAANARAATLRKYRGWLREAVLKELK